MRLSKRRRETLPVMNMTPMIDIVFLLIIFFMTVTQISEIQREDVELSVEPGAEDQRPAHLIVNVTADEEIIVSGAPTTVAQLVAYVDDEIKIRGGDPARVQVTLRVDKRSRSGPVNRVVEALRRLQVNRVRIAVETPGLVGESS